ncbi:short-chain fatty acid transporter [Pleomorphovibrio marinus]|uniref:short-chain fatty acid transporter n=1 Tax=Pleomorphovibrio marinus TaxID=2164132 RepID=UPI000E0B9B6C|nr:TIGR00366 family protein [Pleomorphovibrio marinus]
MMHRFSLVFSKLFRSWVPDAFVFALSLTILCVIVVWAVTEASFLEIITAWYTGFWDLLEFGMQMVLILVTGYAIALSGPFQKLINRLAQHVHTPIRVYGTVMLVGAILSFVSWSWVVVTAIFARQLAERVNGVDYPYLVACVYLTFHGWVGGFSSTIPLLLNTPDNFLIQQGILQETIPTSSTLLTPLNAAFVVFILLAPPILMVLFRPRRNPVTLDSLLLNKGGENKEEKSVEEEALKTRNTPPLPSDRFNHSVWLLFPVVGMGFVFLFHHFYQNGFSLDLSIMIFSFLIVGMALHQTPMRYVLAMKKASSNVSGIIFQYPFYAGIMGIMLYTGLGDKVGEGLAELATIATYPAYSFFAGAIVNFAIPSAGGEFAVLAPGIVVAIKELSTGMPDTKQTEMIARGAMAIAYGESLTNLLQPFFLLTITPVMFHGVNIQIRDVLGFLFIPFLIYLVIELLMVSYLPMQL